MFNRMSFGSPRAATGGDADREVTISSDLAPQSGRQMEYQDFAKLLIDTIRGALADKGYVAGQGGSDGSRVAEAMKALDRAKRAITKAESVDEDDDADEDDQADRDSACEKAAGALKKAKKMLADAIECDEDEGLIEKAVGGFKKARRDLEALKSRPAQSAETKEIAAISEKADLAIKSLQKWESQVSEMSRSPTDTEVKNVLKSGEMLSGSVEHVMSLISGVKRTETTAQTYSALVQKADRIRGILSGIGGLMKSAGKAGFPPGPLAIKKAGGPANFNARIEELDAAGQLTAGQRLAAKSFAAQLGAAGSDRAMVAAVRERISAHPNLTVRSIFD